MMLGIQVTHHLAYSNVKVVSNLLLVIDNTNHIFYDTVW
jgi:hypothetical protein